MRMDKQLKPTNEPAAWDVSHVSPFLPPFAFALSVCSSDTRRRGERWNASERAAACGGSGHTEHDTRQDRRRGGDRALLCAPHYLAIEQRRVSRILHSHNTGPATVLTFEGLQKTGLSRAGLARFFQLRIPNCVINPNSEMNG